MEIANPKLKIDVIKHSVENMINVDNYVRAINLVMKNIEHLGEYNLVQTNELFLL